MTTFTDVISISSMRVDTLMCLCVWGGRGEGLKADILLYCYDVFVEVNFKKFEILICFCLVHSFSDLQLNAGALQDTRKQDITVVFQMNLMYILLNISRFCLIQVLCVNVNSIHVLWSGPHIMKSINQL